MRLEYKLGLVLRKTSKAWGFTDWSHNSLRNNVLINGQIGLGYFCFIVFFNCIMNVQTGKFKSDNY